MGRETSKIILVLVAIIGLEGCGSGSSPGGAGGHGAAAGSGGNGGAAGLVTDGGGGAQGGGPGDGAAATDGSADSAGDAGTYNCALLPDGGSPTNLPDYCSWLLPGCFDACGGVLRQELGSQTFQTGDDQAAFNSCGQCEYEGFTSLCASWRQGKSEPAVSELDTTIPNVYTLFLAHLACEVPITVPQNSCDQAPAVGNCFEAAVGWVATHCATPSLCNQ